MLQLVRAEKGDLPRIVSFYHDVIDHTKNMETFAKWKKGIYPTAEDISAYLEKSAMYTYQDGEEIAGAMALVPEQGEDYRGVSWEIEAEDREVAVIHIFAVHPAYQGRGIGRQMLDEAIRLAGESGKKALRLDSLSTNAPAQRLYTGKGFAYCGKKNLYAGNTGWIDFFFYELVL